MNGLKKKQSRAKSDQSLTSELKQTADEHLEKCRISYRRMLEGIKLLSNKRDAMRAFRLMNESMYMQRAHYKYQANRRRLWVIEDGGKAALSGPFNKPAYTDETGTWYPFQLGFILMNIQSIVEPAHPDREIVDLIWFPTGGGKTEAYLGLTAFVLFHRKN